MDTASSRTIGLNLLLGRRTKLGHLIGETWIDPFTAENRLYRAQQNLSIEQRAEIFHVIHVQLKALFPRCRVPSVDRNPPRNAWPALVSTVLPLRATVWVRKA